MFYQVWSTPLITITKNSWINEIITLCGGKNIFADLMGVSPEISMDAVITANPDVIIGTQSVRNSETAGSLKQWQRWPQLAAVQAKHLLVVDPDLIERASPRVLDGMEKMCHALSFYALSNSSEPTSGSSVN